MSAMVLGDWLVVVQGYRSGAQDLPVIATLKAGLPAIAVLVAPCLVSLRFGLRARRLGHPEWSGPVLAAGLLIGAAVALNMVQVLAKLLSGP